MKFRCPAATERYSVALAGIAYYRFVKAIIDSYNIGDTIK